MRHLYVEDTLELLQDCIRDDSTDLIYHTFPLYSKRDCTLSFRIPEGHRSDRPYRSPSRAKAGYWSSER